MNSPCFELKCFWEEIQTKSVVTLPDLDKLQELLGKAFQSFNELETSRFKWRERALLSESLLKQEKLKIKALNKQISDSGGKKT